MYNYYSMTVKHFTFPEANGDGFFQSQKKSEFIKRRSNDKK